jgi:DNA-directed RNA polymerase subunit N (RpoN/RPB10)
MLYARCPTCGCVLANIELVYIELIKKAENDMELMNEEKKTKEYIENALKELVENDCCRMRLITYSDLVLILH